VADGFAEVKVARTIAIDRALCVCAFFERWAHCCSTIVGARSAAYTLWLNCALILLPVRNTTQCARHAASWHAAQDDATENMQHARCNTPACACSPSHTVTGDTVEFCFAMTAVDGSVLASASER
jgi:hypothetical protein